MPVLLFKIILSLCFCLLSTASALAQPLPKFVAKDGRYTFLVDGKPYIALGAQVHNSSGWASTMEEVWPQLEALHVNTVEVPVYWQSVEPQPGKFNFEELDRIIEGARARKLRLILLWFATWKNGMMNYTPEWIKTNPEKYPHVIGPNGKGILVLSPHSKANLDADRKAFRALMSHLKQFDGTKQTVIMVQVENESGSLGSIRDYSEEANQLFTSAVPEVLVKALKREPRHVERGLRSRRRRVFRRLFRGDLYKRGGKGRQGRLSPAHVRKRLAPRRAHLGTAGRYISQRRSDLQRPRYMEGGHARYQPDRPGHLSFRLYRLPKRLQLLPEAGQSVVHSRDRRQHGQRPIPFLRPGRRGIGFFSLRRRRIGRQPQIAPGIGRYGHELPVARSGHTRNWPNCNRPANCIVQWPSTSGTATWFTWKVTMPRSISTFRAAGPCRAKPTRRPMPMN